MQCVLIETNLVDKDGAIPLFSKTIPVRDGLMTFIAPLLSLSPPFLGGFLWMVLGLAG